MELFKRSLKLHRYFYFLSLITICVAQEGRSEEIIFPNFISSMIREGKSQNKNDEELMKRQHLYLSSNSKQAAFFKSLYDGHISSMNHSDDFYRIPRIVHQIWLGSSVPQKYHDWMSTWANINGWEYKLWTDEDVRQMSLYNQDLYDRAENYGEKADILRLEILEKHGGLYVDVDFECHKPHVFDHLNRCFDFYIGFEPLEHGFMSKFNSYNIFKVCNAILASRPHHPLIKDLIVNMKANYFAFKKKGTCEKTGPNYLTRTICEYEENKPDSYKNLYLPCTFFYPFSEPELREYFSQEGNSLEIMPETAAVHYWSQSWVPQDERDYGPNRNYLFPQE